MSSLRFIVSVKRGLCLYLSGLAIVLKTTVPRFFILDKSARGQGTERKTITIKQLLYDYKKSSNQGIGTTDGMYGRCREEVSEFIHRTNTEKLSEGEGVSIHYFGKLVPHYQTERPGRNLRTGEECKIRARTSVKFKASEILIQKLNPGK